MTILCIETSTNCCSAAITIDGEAQAIRANLTGANHASELPVFIEQLLSEARANQWHIDAVALSQGPGSYTGLRIGTSVAKGLCYGMNIPLIPLDTLQILCATLLHTTPVTSALLSPMLDARRMEVYSAVFSAEGQQLSETEPVIIDAGSFAAQLEEGVVLFIGDGAGKCADVIAHPNARFIQCHPKASAMLAPATCAYKEKRFEDVAYFEPFYLKEFVATVSKKKLW